MTVLPSTVEILHLSTGHMGGAGLAARRLNSALNDAGINSRFLALADKGFIPSKNEIAYERKISKKIKGKVLSLVNPFFSRYVLFTPISVNALSIKAIKKIANPTTTILHIHNWFNLLNEKGIRDLEKIGYRIVLTLHDQRFFTGGCHYSLNCDGFESKCGHCPLIRKPMRFIPRYRLYKNKLLFQNSRIQLLAPSMWIKAQSDIGIVGSRFDSHFIPNFGFNKNYLTRGLKLRTDKFVVGIASMDQYSYVKGGDITAELKLRLDASSNLAEIIFLSEIVKNAGTEETFWNSIDCLMVASRADNSPNVIHEAKIYNVPIIATSVGGISELLDPQFDVSISPENLSVESLMQAIEKVRSHDYKVTDLARMKARYNHYASAAMQLLLDTYEKL